MVRENRLNDLDSKGWLKFTKSWFVHNPSPRKKDEILHPAKYPESMIEEFVRFFTKEGALVFDPFLGTGSTLVACENSGRVGVGIELQEKYGEIARGRIGDGQKVIVGDSFDVKEIWKENNLPEIDFLITSPPYGPMLNKKGLAQQERKGKNLDTKYSEDSRDLGNMDYDLFISKLVELFIEIKELMKERAYLVVVLQNYREGPEFRTLAWDFTSVMKKHFTLSGVKIWCQDNKTLYPYGYLYSFVPNVHHHYCLIFRKEMKE
jgi:DNA modification methylase